MAYHLHDEKKLIHRGTRVNLRVVDLPKRSGGTHRREIAEVADAVVILPLLDSGEVVLIRNDRFSVKQMLWELPAGTLEEGEDPAECAGRELIEETGYAAERIERLTAFYPTPGFCTELLTAFVATGLAHRGQDLDETEHIVVQPVAYDRAIEMVRDGTIRDAKTIATLMYYHTFCRSV